MTDRAEPEYDSSGRHRSHPRFQEQPRVTWGSDWSVAYDEPRVGTSGVPLAGDELEDYKAAQTRI